MSGAKGSGLRIVSRRVDGWLVLNAALPPRERALAPWDALLRVAACPGVAKPVIEPPGDAITLRADIAVEDGVDLAAREREARDALQRLADGSSEPPPAAPAPVDDAVLAEMVRDLAWPFTTRASSRMAATLGVASRLCQAFLESCGDRGCRARVDLVRLPDVAPEVKSGLAVLLLTLGHAIRLVRPGAETRDGQTTLFIEVHIARDVTAPELNHALSALSVASRMVAREIDALTDPDVARTYLAARVSAAPFTQ
jgi:hypothetical protein